MSQPPTISQSPETPGWPASLSRRQRARLERRLGEALAAIRHGEERVGTAEGRVCRVPLHALRLAEADCAARANMLAVQGGSDTTETQLPRDDAVQTSADFQDVR